MENLSDIIKDEMFEKTSYDSQTQVLSGKMNFEMHRARTDYFNGYENLLIKQEGTNHKISYLSLDKDVAKKTFSKRDSLLVEKSRMLKNFYDEFEKTLRKFPEPLVISIDLETTDPNEVSNCIDYFFERFTSRKEA